MFENSYREGYFIWLCRQSYGDNYIKYEKLLRYLYNTEFLYSMPMDENRFKDGMSLRYQYGWIYKINDIDIAENIDICPCSVLEMMVALCKRMDNEYMYSPGTGNRTNLWFESMINNMHLENYTDSIWCSTIVEKVQHRLDIMMDRTYLENGDGGLFKFNRCRFDARRVDLWNQMLNKCNELLGY